jgi:hypothetical protein
MKKFLRRVGSFLSTLARRSVPRFITAEPAMVISPAPSTAEFALTRVSARDIAPPEPMPPPKSAVFAEMLHPSTSVTPATVVFDSASIE